MGYELTTQDRQTINQMRRMLLNIRGPGVQYDPAGNGIFIGWPPNGSDQGGGFECVLARLVAQDTTDCWKWSWQQIRRKLDGSYEDGRLSGDLTHNPAVEVNSNIYCQENDIVILIKFPIVNGDSTAFQMCFASETYGLPQYAGQQLGGPSSNQATWVFPTLHAIVAG